MSAGRGEGGEHPATFKRGAFTIDHLDERGTCDCMCERCTLPHHLVGYDCDDVHNECICPDCDVVACGLHWAPTPELKS